MDKTIRRVTNLKKRRTVDNPHPLGLRAREKARPS